MNTSSKAAKSLLAIDIGSSLTRVLFFDVVNGRFRFIGRGSAPTTAGAPIFDAAEGIWRAIEELQLITERTFLSKDEGVIIPSTPENEGVDMMVATMSAGDPLKVITVGLLDDVSLKTARHLAETTYASVVNEISLNDHRTPSDRINLITTVRPDLIIMAGGTNGGAIQATLNMLEMVGLASYFIEKNQKPHVLYVGNEQLHNEVKSSLENISNLHLAANIQPVLEEEQLYPAQKKLKSIFNEIRKQQSAGVRELLSWANGHFASSASGFGRLIRFLSQKFEPEKGVLGIDIGSSNTVLAAAFSGEETLRVFPDLGVGASAASVLEASSLQQITRWLSLPLSDQTVENYLYQKTAYPDSIPAEPEHLAIEHALARQVLRLAASQSIPCFPKRTQRSADGLLPAVEPIIGAGRVLTQAPNRADSLGILLDGLQPTGVTTLALDQNDILAGLGAIADRNPLMTVQIVETSTFLNLGTIIAPLGSARPGTTILRIQVNRSDGRTATRDIKFGSLVVLPVETGEKVTLHLRPLHKFAVGRGGPGKAGKVNAVGGALGVIIDARGRPLRFFADREKNINRNAAWKKTLQKFE
jgi:uncharacterized protein (TIGR01319 family)